MAYKLHWVPMVLQALSLTIPALSLLSSSSSLTKASFQHAGQNEMEREERGCNIDWRRGEAWAFVDILHDHRIVTR